MRFCSSVDQQQRQPVRAGRRRLVVVVRDKPAHRHARADVEQRQHRVEHRAADVLEIDVDAVRAGGGEALGQLRIAAVEADVEAELFDRVAALVGAAGDADHARALELGDLPDHRADRTGRRGHDHGFARLGLADVEQADVGGERGHAEPAQRQRRLRHLAEREQILTVRQRVVLPAGVAEHQIAGAELRMLGGDDAVDRAAHHGLAQRHRRRVDRPDFVHQVAHVRIERKVQRAQQHLPFVRRRDGGFVETEVLRRRQAARARGEDDAAIDGIALRHGACSRIFQAGPPTRVSAKTSDNGEACTEGRWPLQRSSSRKAVQTGRASPRPRR